MIHTVNLNAWDLYKGILSLIIYSSSLPITKTKVALTVLDHGPGGGSHRQRGRPKLTWHCLFLHNFMQQRNSANIGTFTSDTLCEREIKSTTFELMSNVPYWIINERGPLRLSWSTLGYHIGSKPAFHNGVIICSQTHHWWESYSHMK